jgi:hypothetical protein
VNDDYNLLEKYEWLGENDLERQAISEEDSPIIPGDVKKAPVLAILDRKKCVKTKSFR